VRLKVMLLNHGAADGGKKPLRHRDHAAAPPADLVDDDEPFLAVFFQAERSPAVACERRVAHLDGSLDVLRIMVLAAYDDCVRQPSGHVQLAVGDKSQIAGAQERSITAIGEPCCERLLGFRRAAEIACGDRTPLHPDLADFIGATLAARFGSSR
jgi:hypothetical protein